jgi:two-component sensor histidine kinase
MREYAQELLQYLRQGFDTGNRITFKLDIDDIDLDVLRAVPLGLIMNEAITNALRHAFPDNSYGNVSIMLSCVDGKYLRLKVIDNGTGLPLDFSVDLCQSLGINLIKGMCRQLDGSLEIRNEKGVLIMLLFPQGGDLNGIYENDEMSPFGEIPKSL